MRDTLAAMFFVILVSLMIWPEQAGREARGIADKFMTGWSASRPSVRSARAMDAFQKKFPHLKWGFMRRRWFLIRYDIGMLLSRCRTAWHKITHH